MGCDRSGQSVILVIGRRLELPWSFAGDELGACTACAGLVRYRPIPGFRAAVRPGIVLCAGCGGPRVEPGDVWILPEGT
jgi:hypothetical protein